MESKECSEKKSSAFSSQRELITPRHITVSPLDYTKPVPARVVPFECDNEKKSSKQKRKKPNRHLRTFKRIVRFLVTHFGMLTLTVFYCLGGAYLYGILEMQNLLQTCEMAHGESEQMIQDYSLEIFNYLSYNVTFDPLLPTGNNDTLLDGPDVYNNVVYDYLVQLEKDVISNGYYGQDCDATNRWLFPNALLWTITVVTSIGI